MCGIFGAVRFGNRPVRECHLLDGMADLLRHRGPDGAGVLRANDAVLGACRLRVRDPRSAGDQPFTDPSGRLWVACNGEIYNGDQLRDDHREFPFRSRSDVEPVVPVLLRHGPAGIEQLDGMFALAAWDVCRQRLIMARDRAGEKPLFYCRLDDEVWFASEIQALLNHPRLTRDVNPRALDDFLTVGYVLEPKTMFTGISKVPAGTVLVITADREEVVPYWFPPPMDDLACSEPAAIDELDRLLQQAVAKQVVADVPVGIFTSGGVDSALLAAMATKALHRPLRLFTVGFPARSFDETAAAARVAHHLDVPHIVVRAGARELCDALEILIDTVAEPIADPAVLPTYLLARRAREEVKVALSGEGADELFGGYPTYLGHRLSNAFAALPSPIGAMIGALIGALPPSHRTVSPGFLLKRFVGAATDPDWLRRHVRWFGTGIPDPARIDRWVTDHRRLVNPCPQDQLSEILMFDYRTYLRDGLLTKLDRATMLASVEARAPYIDSAVTRFAFGLHSRLKMRGWATKWVLKEVARRWLPSSIVDRRKHGLSVPIASWLRGALRPEVNRLLDHERQARPGVLEPRLTQQLVAEHLSGRADHARALWPLLVYERWHDRWLGG